MKKKILFFVLAFIAGFSFLVNNVTADGVPDLANSVTFYKENLNTSVNRDSKVSMTYYKYVYDAAKGHAGIAYCMNVGYNNPPHGSTVTKTADITDPRLLYIMQHGYTAINGQISKGDLADLTDHQAYYVTQLAIWLYKGQGNGGYAASQFTQDNPWFKRALALYNASAGATETSTNPWIENAVGSFELHYDAANKRYISDQMHIVGYVFDRYTITLSNAPAGTKLIKENGQEFASGSSFEFKGNDDSIANGNYYIVVPESSVKSKVTGITLNVSANTYVTRVFLYQSSTPNLQPLGVLVPVNSTISTTQQYSINPTTPKCEDYVNQLKKQFPNNRTTSNKEYMKALNEAKQKDSTINTDAGVDNPRCNPPKCSEILDYLNRTYPNNKSESNKTYKAEIDALLKKNYGLNIDAGYENPKCEAPKCEEVLEHLKKKYPKCDEKDQNYKNELEALKKKYVIYVDDKICEPSCQPKKGPSCTEKRDELLKKYPNPGDRNQNNSLYVEDINAIIKLGQENGWKFYINDYTNPDCVPHAKREVRIRKVACDAKGENCVTDLSGASLVLKDANGTIIDSWTSDGTARVFTTLAPGNYSVYETNPPGGYAGTDRVDFTVPNDDSDYSIEVIVKNTPLVETGDINFTLIVTAFILFLGFGIFGLIKTSQREDM